MKNKTARISAVIIAKNEEPRISPCLESLAFSDEIIVVDNGSTDGTVALAKRAGARVIPVSGGDFSTLRTAGKQAASGTWILYVDADERVTPELAREIQGVVRRYNGTGPVAYFIRRENWYLGAKWAVQDKMQRLFLSAKLRSWHGPLHETADVDGETGTLDAHLIHRTHRTLEEMVEKTNRWSRTEAELRLEANHPPVVWWRLLRVMITGFTRSFFGEGGWKMGTVGWIEAIFQAFSMFITYAKLWELQNSRDNRHEQD